MCSCAYRPYCETLNKQVGEVDRVSHSREEGSTARMPRWGLGEEDVQETGSEEV
jgi:hypothetical protein